MEEVQREKEKTEGQRQRDQGSTSGWFLIGVNYDVPMTTGQVLTVAGEGHRLLRLGDFYGHFDGAAGVPGAVPLGDDGTQDVPRVGGHVIMRE